MAEEIKNNSAPTAPEKNANKVEAKKEKSSKPGLVKRCANFFKEYRSELKKVVWYPKDRVIHDTGIVVAALAVCGLAIGLLDLLFTQIILLLGKIG
ncbi:MAG: preprotein translocase subunit SecE [Clostridia bacterium]|nr:preprotein translocase subunit SecE [Clostridia bacterium]